MLDLILRGKTHVNMPEKESEICEFIWKHWEKLEFVQEWEKHLNNNWVGEKRFDISATNARNEYLIIETKKDEAKIDALLQLIGYMSMQVTRYEEVNGILIARKFGSDVYNAARKLTKNIRLMNYEMTNEGKFTFNAIDENSILTHALDKDEAAIILAKLQALHQDDSRSC